jgi:hypothetical protein
VLETNWSLPLLLRAVEIRAARVLRRWSADADAYLMWND